MIGNIALVTNFILISVVSLLLAVEQQDIWDTTWGKCLFVSLILTCALIRLVWGFYSAKDSWSLRYWERRKADERKERLKELDRKLLEKSEERRKLEESE